MSETTAKLRSRRTLHELRQAAEAAGITYWDDEWTRADFEEELARQERDSVRSETSIPTVEPEA